jgi:hypothetical protein
MTESDTKPSDVIWGYAGNGTGYAALFIGPPRPTTDHDPGLPFSMPSRPPTTSPAQQPRDPSSIFIVASGLGIHTTFFSARRSMPSHTSVITQPPSPNRGARPVGDDFLCVRMQR